MSPDVLPQSRPAEQGVSSRGITRLLDALDAAPDIELHSMMLLRHGHIVAQGWWAPYTADRVHLLYSLSKSVTATAAGLAEAEGLLSFDAPVVSYLPELATAARHRWTQQRRVAHLVAMATGHRDDTLQRARRTDPAEPLRGLLALEPAAEPGSLFGYDNGATYALGALVQRVTGQRLTEYLRPRLFEPLGIEQFPWHRDDTGRELGYSGLHLTTEALARFGQLHLDDGRWQGRRLLPQGWVERASRLHLPTADEPDPDWQQGYGFQFWRSRHGYRGDGAFGQFCLVLPEQDAVLVTTAQTENMQGILDAVWRELLPAFQHPTPEEDDALAARLEALELSPTASPPDPVLPAALVQPRVYRVVPDREDGWLVTLADGEQGLTVRCGRGQWWPNSFTLSGGRRLDVAATGTLSGRGDPGQHLVVQLVFVDTPHRLVLQIDLSTRRSSGHWQTVPLHAPSFAGLAVAVDGESERRAAAL